MNTTFQLIRCIPHLSWIAPIHGEGCPALAVRMVDREFEVFAMEFVVVLRQRLCELAPTNGITFQYFEHFLSLAFPLKGIQDYFWGRHPLIAETLMKARILRQDDSRYWDIATCRTGTQIASLSPSNCVASSLIQLMNRPGRSPLMPAQHRSLAATSFEPTCLASDCIGYCRYWPVESPGRTGGSCRYDSESTAAVAAEVGQSTRNNKQCACSSAIDGSQFVRLLLCVAVIGSTAKW